MASGLLGWSSHVVAELQNKRFISTVKARRNGGLFSYTPARSSQ
jgi:hypothetical protein